jgi:hypothetical protein
MKRGAASRAALPLDWPAGRRAIERELARTVRQGEEPAYPSILLGSPDGRSWRLRVDDTGTLLVEEVPRT